MKKMKLIKKYVIRFMKHKILTHFDVKFLFQKLYKLYGAYNVLQFFNYLTDLKCTNFCF